MISKNRIPHKNGKKRCARCKIYKVLSEFGPDKRRWDKKQHACYSCERKRGLEKANRRQSESYIQFITARMNVYKKNALRRKRKFNLSKVDLINLYEKQKGLCAMSKVKLTILTGKGKINSNLSLDRINPNKDYNISNVRWVTYLVNTLKQEMNDNKFKIFCQNLISK